MRRILSTIFFGAAGCALGAASFLACSSDDSAAGSDAGGDVNLIEPDSGDGSTADASGDAGTVADIGGRNFVTHVLYLGDVGRDGGTSATAWQEFGADIDGKTTDTGSTDVCELYSGASTNVQADGPGGLDNSFGKNVLPIFESIFGSNLDSQVNMQIDQGGATFMIDLNGLTDDAAQTLDPLPGQLFGGVHVGAPTWDTTSRWEVYKNTTAGGTLASGAKANFSTAKIANGTWASNGTSDVQLSAAGLTITLHHASVVFTHVSAHHLSGTVSGVIDTEEFVEAVRVGFARLEGESFCSGSTFDGFASQIRQSSDILKDGTNVSGMPCNGISAGIGFDSDETLPPNTAVDLPAEINPCGD